MTPQNPNPEGNAQDQFLSLASRYLPEIQNQISIEQTYIPDLAKDPDRMKQVRAAASEVETEHKLHQGDAREFKFIESESVHLIVTSPPYWTLKEYPKSEGQLGNIADYDDFLEQLDLVWEECFRVLVPGGRLVVIVGDVCMSRRSYGRHVVFPLHASIQESCRKIGFDNLTPIIWYKIANANFEAKGGSFLGKPYEPNGVIKNDIEYILMQRKLGGYRKPTPGMRVLSTISYNELKSWFQSIWTVPGASTKEHPAPFPVKIAERLVRMFSFVGDTVLDPFAGSGSTIIAAAQASRNSIGIEIEEQYLEYTEERFREEVDSDVCRLVTLDRKSI